MSKNIKTPMVATETSNLMTDLIKFFFLGEYTCRDYEYTFYLNGEEFKADECFSNFYGRSYCEYNGVTYNNVEYTKVLVNEYEETNAIIPIFTFGILLFFIINVIYKLFFYYVWGEFIFDDMPTLFILVVYIGIKLLIRIIEKEKVSENETFFS